MNTCLLSPKTNVWTIDVVNLGFWLRSGVLIHAFHFHDHEHAPSTPRFWIYWHLLNLMRDCFKSSPTAGTLPFTPSHPLLLCIPLLTSLARNHGSPNASLKSICVRHTFAKPQTFSWQFRDFGICGLSEPPYRAMWTAVCLESQWERLVC